MSIHPDINYDTMLVYKKQEDFFMPNIYELELDKVLLELDPSKSPETIEYLKAQKDEDLSAYELATGLVNCDTRNYMPKEPSICD